MAGGKSLSENYAFSGMHHIFDQHTAAGLASFLHCETVLIIARFLDKEI